MSEEHFPVGSPDRGDRLPARHDGQATRQMANMRSAATSLALDIQEELRDDEIDLLAYWHILVKRRWMVLSILTGVMALALLLTLLTTPLYRASVMLELQKEGTQVVQVGGVQPGDFGGWDPEFLQTQYKLIQSRSLAGSAGCMRCCGRSRSRTPSSGMRRRGRIRKSSSTRPPVWCVVA